MGLDMSEVVAKWFSNDRLEFKAVEEMQKIQQERYI